MELLEFLWVWLLGGGGYCLLELLWRGRTHWTMFLAGGVCVLLMYLIATRTAFPPWQKWIACAAAITAVEFTAGCIVNLRLGWDVWDYSALPLNLGGQICALYSFFWFLLSIPGCFVCAGLHRGLMRALHG